MEAAAQSTHSLKNGSDLAVGFAESQRRSSAAEGQRCYRCGKPGHTAMQCSFKEATYHNCGKKGHLARVCRGSKKPSKGPGVSRRANVVDKQTSEVEEFHSENSISYTMHHLGNRASLLYKAVVRINQQLVEMEIDTGAAVSIISRENWRALFPRKSLSKASVTLRTYTAQPIALVGQVDVEVHYRSYKGILKLYVVEGNGPTLLGAVVTRTALTRDGTVVLTKTFPVSQEILSPGNSVAATIFPRKFCRSILTQRPHFLGNSVRFLHRDTLPRSTAEFDIGGGTRGHWGPVPPLMSRAPTDV